MFRRIVLKMRETLTFSATIKNEHWNHENAGRYLALGAADHHRRGLFRSAFDQRAGDRAADKLARLEDRLLGGQMAMLSVDQFLRLVSVPAVFAAFLIASQISAAVTPQPNPMVMASD
jgi:hypothetical protein